jgi:transaldolase
MTISASAWRVKIYADGADHGSMCRLAANPLIRGFTTNPSLMRKAGVTEYEAFARRVIADIPDRPISFEVFADDLEGMEAQCRRIAAWGPQVYVKLPVTNTQGESIVPLLRRLAPTGVKLNVTAIFTERQLEEVSAALADAAPCCLSVFAGRIADTGVDPLPLMRLALGIMAPRKQQELIWASPRELLNIVQAHDMGCHIITVTPDILAKLPLLGKDLQAFSLETVKMFHDDALASGFAL